MAALVRSGRWVFRGETLEELREQAGMAVDGGGGAGGEYWNLS